MILPGRKSTASAANRMGMTLSLCRNVSAKENEPASDRPHLSNQAERRSWPRLQIDRRHGPHTPSRAWSDQLPDVCSSSI